MAEQETALLRDEGDVSTILINRPHKKNSLTASCLKAVAQMLEELSSRTTVPVVVLRGAGDEAFSAGYDITALPVPSNDRDTIEDTPPLEDTLQAIERFPYPVIAMVKGQALGGGCELAIACDIRIAGRSVVMGMPPAKLGLVYPYQGYRRFLRIIGFSRSAEMFFTGRRYKSMECLAMGLVNHVMDDSELEDFTYAMAREIAQNAPMSVKGTKQALRVISGYPRLEQEDENSLHALFLRSLESEDMAEAKKAFAEKRKPRFRGC
ncbi:MAG: enoyl-CoA hydratase [Desulfobacteraceae bacterium]|nr:MAG: enoyl-CoA hydratase [Desulfobacteraceae bacterium]